MLKAYFIAFLFCLAPSCLFAQKAAGKGSKRMLSVCSADSRFFAYDSADKALEGNTFWYFNTIRVYHVRSRRYIAFIKQQMPEEPKAMVFNERSDCLLLKGDKSGVLFHVRSRKRLLSIPDAKELLFVQGGAALAQWDGTQLQLYSTADGEKMLAYKGMHESPEWARASVDGNWLVAKGQHHLFVWKNGQAVLKGKIPALQGRLVNSDLLVIAYRQGRAFLDVVPLETLQAKRSIDSNDFLPVSQYTFREGHTISPDGDLVAFCVKKLGFVDSIGVFSIADGSLLARLAGSDSLRYESSTAQMPQPYQWWGNDTLLLADGNGKKAHLAALSGGYTSFGLFHPRDMELELTADGRFQGGGRGIGTFFRSTDPKLPKEVWMEGKFLRFSPNGQYAFVRLPDRTLGYVVLSEVPYHAYPPVYLFSKIPYTGALEDPIDADAEAPEGYKHVYLETLQEGLQGSQAQLEILSSYQKKDTAYIRLHLHSEDGVLYQGLSNPSDWCLVEGLTADGWKPLEGTKVQELREQSPSPIALAVALDHSGSMGEGRTMVVQHAARALISQKYPQDIVGVWKYDGKAFQAVPFSADTAKLLAKLPPSGLEGYGGGTAIHDAVSEAIAQLKKVPLSEKAVVVMTDGQENSSILSRSEVIADALKAKIKIFAIGFGTGVDTAALKELAEATGGRAYQIYQTPDFDRIFADVYRRLHNYYDVRVPLGMAITRIRIAPCGIAPCGIAPIEVPVRPLRVPKDPIPSFLPEELKIKEKEKEQASRLTSLKALKKGESALLQVQFYFDTDQPMPGYEEDLAIVVAYLKSEPQMRAILRGHTDSRGSATYNQLLSQRRAQKVKEFLAGEGIHSERIQVAGIGEAEPIAENTTEKGRAQNRRTELRLE